MIWNMPENKRYGQRKVMKQAFYNCDNKGNNRITSYSGNLERRKSIKNTSKTLTEYGMWGSLVQCLDRLRRKRREGSMVQAETPIETVTWEVVRA